MDFIAVCYHHVSGLPGNPGSKGIPGEPGRNGSAGEPGLPGDPGRKGTCLIYWNLWRLGGWGCRWGCGYVGVEDGIVAFLRSGYYSVLDSCCFVCLLPVCCLFTI